jgi:altronate dehydratase small subunit
MNCIVMSNKDNVATVLNKVLPGIKLKILDSSMRQIGVIRSEAEIPFGHKISLKNIEADANIIKYGEIIGKATKRIKAGDYVHIHNVVSIEGSEKVI